LTQNHRVELTGTATPALGDRPPERFMAEVMLARYAELGDGSRTTGRTRA
jgi:hypothetical protein